MANTPQDDSAVVTFPRTVRVTITDANKWLKVTVPPLATHVSVEFLTNDGFVVFDTTSALDTDDSYTSATDPWKGMTADTLYEVQLHDGREVTKKSAVDDFLVASATGATVVELEYSRRMS